MGGLLEAQPGKSTQEFAPGIVPKRNRTLPAYTSGCGTVDASGNYTAPQILPSPASAILTVQSIADPSKQISAAVAITSNFSLHLSAPSSIPAGGTATIVATLTLVPGSNPSTALSWTLSGQGCNGNSCGTLTGGHDAIDGRNSRHGFGSVHRAKHGAKSQQRYGNGYFAGRPFEKSSSHIGSPAGN
jgi:hypothetical protein